MQENKTNIILIGLMGAGKTTIGRILAKHYKFSFVDSDHEIENLAGTSILNIFELEGEEKFRNRESKVLASLAEKKNIVLATGGGAILREENRQILRKSGYVIYLHAKPYDLWKRTYKDKKRPLLQTANPLEKLKQLYAQRHQLYCECAHAVLTTKQSSVFVFVNKIIHHLELANIEL